MQARGHGVSVPKNNTDYHPYPTELDACVLSPLWQWPGEPHGVPFHSAGSPALPWFPDLPHWLLLSGGSQWCLCDHDCTSVTKKKIKAPWWYTLLFINCFWKCIFSCFLLYTFFFNLYSASRMKCWVAQLRQWVSQSITFPVYCPSPSACLCPHQWVAQMQISGSFLQASYSLAIKLLFLSPE